MHRSIHVIDSFYSNPDAVRELALRKGDWTPPKSQAGVKYSSETRTGFYTAEMAERFADIVGSKILFDPARMGFGVFALHDYQAGVEFSTHYDETDYAAVIYLTPDHLCQGGISFLRHRDTGLQGPPARADLDRMNLTGEQFEREIYYPDKMRPAAWEETSRIAMRYNRAVIMHGSRLFHRANSKFGSGPSDGRLSQRFFFNIDTEAI